MEGITILEHDENQNLIKKDRPRIKVITWTVCGDFPDALRMTLTVMDR